MKWKLNVALLLCSVTFAAVPIEPSATLFENDQVIVVRALEKAQVKGKFHEHKMNRVMIYLQPGKQRFEYQDGRKPATFDFKEGQVKWSAPEGMHSGQVLTSKDFNIIEVELKKAGSGKAVTSSLDPLKTIPDHYKLEFENGDVRVYRARMGPHQSVPKHEHSVNRVMVFLTDQNFRTVDDHGKVETLIHKAGDAVWATPVIHKEENLSDKPFEVIVVELKS